VVDHEESYYYVRDEGRTFETTQADQAYSVSPITNNPKQLSVLKPLHGEWRFRVHRKIQRALFLPFFYLPFAPQEEIWDSVVFTNQNRPPDVNPILPNGPFE
jgi:hypothetical protein